MINSTPHYTAKGSRAVIDIIKAEGPLMAQVISEHLGVTAMAVRQHLYDLTEQNMVTFTERRQGAGRPAKIWRLTEAADKYFPDAHADLAVGLIHTVRSIFGDAGIDQLIEVRTATQIKCYGKALGGKQGLNNKISALAQVRSEEGYMAEVSKTEEGEFLFIERHCPICSAAKTCTGLCASELEVFQKTLGPDVSVERTEHILAGAMRCAYKVTPLK